MSTRNACPDCGVLDLDCHCITPQKLDDFLVWASRIVADNKVLAARCERMTIALGHKIVKQGGEVYTSNDDYRLTRGYRKMRLISDAEIIAVWNNAKSGPVAANQLEVNYDGLRARIKLMRANGHKLKRYRSGRHKK